MKLQRQFKLDAAAGTEPPVVIPPVTPPKVEAPKLEQVLEYMGFEDVKTFPEFQDKLSQEWIRKNLEVVRGDEKFYGQLLGAKSKGTMNAGFRALKENAILYDENEFKDLKLETFVESAITKAAKSYSEKVKSLEEQLAAAGTDERVTKLQADLDAVNAKYQEATGKIAATQTEWETKYNQREEDIKTLNKKSAEERSYGGVKYASGVDELKKKGFVATVKEQVTFEFDEAGKFVPMKDGKKIPNPLKADTFYTAEEYLQSEANKAGIGAVSPHNGKVEAPKKVNTVVTPAEDVKPHNMINPLRPKIRATGV